mgnify:CR=1 FL=1
MECDCISNYDRMAYEMIIFIYALLGLNIIKAFHDKHVIVEDKTDRRAWHVYYWFHYVVMCIGFALLVNPHFVYWFPMAGYAITIRIILFNTILNILRGKPLFYLGSEGVDGLFKERRALYYIPAAIGFAVSLYMLLQYG